MAKQKTNANSQDELLEQVRHLEDRVHKLQESAKQSPCKAEGLAEGLMTALGKMVPGLGKLVETASRMPEFHDRLASIDEEIKRRFKDQPMRQAAAGISGIGARRQMGIPPAVRRGGAGRHTKAGANHGETAVPRGKYPQPKPWRVHINPETPAELAVDVFDEETQVLVLADAPGLDLGNITVSLEGRALVISVAAPNRNVLQRIDLPCEVAGQPQVSLANGILNIQLEKVDTT